MVATRRSRRLQGQEEETKSLPAIASKKSTKAITEKMGGRNSKPDMSTKDAAEVDAVSSTLESRSDENTSSEEVIALDSYLDAEGSKEKEEDVLVLDSASDNESEKAVESAPSEENIDAYVDFATSNLNFDAPASTSKAKKPTRKLVPDTLDSGAASKTSYFDFESKKDVANGTQLSASQRDQEDDKNLKAELNVRAHAKVQQAQSKSTSDAGHKWFGMASHELTAEAKRDFALLRMRNYLDPKKFYKTSDHGKKGMPKHFQQGVVIEGTTEAKNMRLTKRQRQKTFTEEVMADEGIQGYTKRVFTQIQRSRAGRPGKKRKTR